MKKVVSSTQLLPGMYVVDLNAGWMDHPFIRSQFRVSQRDIERIVEYGVDEVVIDTTKGLDTDDAIPLDVADEAIKCQLADIASTVAAPLEDSPATTTKDAAAIVDHAIAAIRTLMLDASEKRQINPVPLQSVAEEIAVSVTENNAMLATILSLQRYCDYTYAHSIRVGVLLACIANRLQLPKATRTALALGGLLHDVGKMLVPQDVLRKPEKLSEDEMAEMRRHVELGNVVMDTTHLPAEALEVLTQHHERMDGKGYPLGLKGEKISLAGRLAAIADVYDALTSDRWYHQGIPAPVAIRKIFEWSPSHFDRKLVECFISCVGIYPLGSLVRLNNQTLAVVVHHPHANLLRPSVLPVFDTEQKQLLDSPVVDLSDRFDLEIIGCENPSDWDIDVYDYIFKVAEVITNRNAKDAAPSPAADCWKLLTEGWRLISPKKVPVELSRREFVFLEQLARSPNVPVRRQTIVDAMGFAPEHYDYRRLDTFVSRLRNKVMSVTGQQLPMKTVTAVGYSVTCAVALDSLS
jgi:putative nucleotidyltransferase with HDIG domain